MAFSWLNQKFFQNRSLGTSLFIWVLSGALLGLGTMSFLFYRVLEKQAENDIRGKLNSEVLLVEKRLAEVERTGLQMAIAIGNLHDQGINDPEAYKNFVFQTYLQLPELVMGVGFGQKPYAVLGDRQWYWPYFYREQYAAGQIGIQLPPPHQNVRFTDLFKDDNYPQQDYYTQAIDKGKPVWIEPYRWYVLTMTSYLAPIRDRDQKIIGITGLDVNVSSISQAINHPVFAGEGYFMILSKKGNLLAYPPDPSKAEKLVTQSELPEIANFFQRITESPQTVLKLNNSYWVHQKVQGTDWIMIAKVPSSAVLKPVLMITLGGSFGVATIMAIVVFFFIRRLNRRLKPILEECQIILLAEQGLSPTDLSLSKQRFQGDEIEILAQSFHQTTQQLKISLEYTRNFNHALEKIVPKEFLEFLGKTSFMEVKLGDQIEQKLSVLFADIRNFTSLSEAMTPEENFQFINAYFGYISPAIRENKGFIDKYIGDAIMALFGGSADDAVKAGLNILERLIIFNQKRQEQGLKAIEIGIGINTGYLMIGTVGEESRMENTVISDAVNVASRIEQLTKIYRVPLLISQSTMKHLRDPSVYAIRMLEKVKIKGKTQSITIYEVFEGDHPELKAKKIAMQPLFEKAVTKYQLYLFAEAEQLFQQCLQQNPKDYVLRHYIDRCQEKLYCFKVSTLEESFYKMQADFPQVAITFYEQLFKRFPNLSNLFSKTDIERQQTKFAQMIELMIVNLRDPATVTRVLKDLGRRHTNYSVIAEYYPMIREALLDTFAIHLGEDWTPEVSQAWDEAYSLIQEAMLSGANQPKSLEY